MEALIRLSVSFDIPTIAEGVETAEQVFTLKAMGCDIIQGYYFSRPLPADEFEKFVTKNKGRPFAKTEKKNPTRTDEFTYKALHDPLTGVYNYSAFDILFHDADRDHVAVLVAQICDYDKIKNDSRDEADKVVCRVADVLKAHFRSVDHICRLSEDEFVVIVTRVTRSAKNLLLSKLDAVNTALKEPKEDMQPIELFVGVAFSDRENPDGDVFQNADTAMKRLKKTKKTGYSVF